MQPTLTIGQLSKLVDLPTKTIRYYEEIALINSTRLENNYRVYSQDTLEELKLIKSARDLGLPIAQIKKLIAGCQEGDCHHSSQYLQQEITSYVSLLDHQLAQMAKLKERLLGLNQKISTPGECDPNSDYCCNILHQLVSSKGGE